MEEKGTKEGERQWMGRGNNSSRGIATRPRNSARSGQFCWPLPSHSSFFFFFIFQSRDRGYISLTYTYPIPGRDSLRKSQLIMAKPPTPRRPHLSPRGSLLLSDIVINRGIIPKTAHLALPPSPALSLHSSSCQFLRSPFWEEGKVSRGTGDLRG